MLDENQIELATTGLGIVTLGAGSVFALFPKLGGWGFGLKPETNAQGGTQAVLRALGFRDIALGLGLLANRQPSAATKLWLRLFALCMGGDVLACALALRKPGVGVMTVVAGLSSVFFGAVAWLTAQATEKEQK